LPEQQIASRCKWGVQLVGDGTPLEAAVPEKKGGTGEIVGSALATGIV